MENLTFSFTLQNIYYILSVLYTLKKYYIVQNIF